ncbi:MAG: glycosyltransferase family 4 protein [Albidovulum sp.]|uniref:glycosyltransferase family 4 protein n=1 Tax=Albidovulum sp. TaxID=1872424 RepID=UPI003C9B1055
MRIAYVSADRGIPVFGAKGASIHIQAMMRAFAALGHEVRALSARKGATLTGALSVEEVGSPAPSGANRATKESAAMTQARAIEDRLIALYRDWPFDLIYERYSLWSAAGIRAGARLGLPVVTEVNAPLLIEQSEYRELVHADQARAIEAVVFARSDILAAVSWQVAEYAVSRGAGPERVKVIGNGVDTARFHPGVEPARVGAIPDDAYVVGFTGSLKAWHGVETLLRAFGAFRRNCPDAHLLILGDGPQRGWIEGFAEGAGFGGAMTISGWVDHADLAPLIARMDVATAPYPEDDSHYFSPLKLYEYLAMGRPVVASRIGQTAELLTGSDAAWLLPPGDAGALARALATLHADPSRRAAMSQAAAAEGRKHDWTENARRVIAPVEKQRTAA